MRVPSLDLGEAMGVTSSAVGYTHLVGAASRYLTS
jgi:hypothetical protein